jgi:integrase
LSVAESVEQTRDAVRIKDTKNGRARTVALPAMVCDELKRHRVSQAEEMLKIGSRVDGKSFLVAREDGGPLQPNSITHEFTRILALAPSTPRIRFHDLRHSHATHLLASGVHPKIAQERLGHSTVKTRIDLYSHVMPEMQEDAAARIDDAIRAAVDKHCKSVMVAKR